MDLLNRRCHGGKALDTLEWDFMIVVFALLVFFDKFCDWILSILESSRIFILLNGSP